MQQARVLLAEPDEGPQLAQLAGVHGGAGATATAVAALNLKGHTRFPAQPPRGAVETSSPHRPPQGPTPARRAPPTPRPGSAPSPRSGGNVLEAEVPAQRRCSARRGIASSPTLPFSSPLRCWSPVAARVPARVSPAAETGGLRGRPEPVRRRSLAPGARAP